MTSENLYFIYINNSMVAINKKAFYGIIEAFNPIDVSCEKDDSIIKGKVMEIYNLDDTITLIKETVKK